MKSKFVKLTFCLLFAVCISAFRVRAAEPVTVYINGEELQSSASYILNSTAYVPMKLFCKAICPEAEIFWDAETKTASVKADNLNMSVVAGGSYLLANERCLYLKDTAVVNDGIMFLPVRELAKVFGASVEWDSSSSCVSVTSGSGFIETASSFYNEKELYWLSRIINAESCSEPLVGKIAVGNVVINRTKSPSFPDTIYGVIFDKKNGTQFQPVANRSIYCSPNAESIIAAKICLEGYSVSDSCLFFQNPSISKSTWISRNCVFVMSIGHHAFYS